jgi:delta14-sterol reductase
MVHPISFLTHGLNYDNDTNTLYVIAFATLLLALGLTGGFIFRFGAGAFTFIYDRWLGFVTASLVMSVFQAFAVYAFSFQKDKVLALGGNSGNPLFDVSTVTSCLNAQRED